MKLKEIKKIMWDEQPTLGKINCILAIVIPVIFVVGFFMVG